MFIGYYSLANGVTLFGLISAIIACFLAANGNFKLAVWMLFIAFICDSVDGRLARQKDRSKKPRDESGVSFGVQLDSLCDCISFGFAPCFIAYSFGFDTWLDMIIYCIFIACGVIRLAYYNVLTLGNKNKKAPTKSFVGVPIPASVFVMTVLILFTTFIPATAMAWLFRIALLFLAIAYVLRIKVPKPKLKTGLILLLVEVLLLFILAIAGDCKTPVNAPDTDSSTDITAETSEQA